MGQKFNHEIGIIGSYTVKPNVANIISGNISSKVHKVIYQKLCGKYQKIATSINLCWKNSETIRNIRILNKSKKSEISAEVRNICNTGKTHGFLGERTAQTFQEAAN